LDALQNINLDIQRGEIFGIIGRSGAGKSTLIRCLNRLEDPTAGRIVIDGTDISALNARQLVEWRRSTGMIFQHFNLLSAKTVRQNIELPLKVAGVPAAVRARKVDELLALVGLEARQHAWPAQLSGGQKQRVGIARALVHDPELLPEARPGIVSGFTITLVKMINASAMAGAIGAGGLGDLAYPYGYQRFDMQVMVTVIVVLVALVTLLQLCGDRLSRRLNHR